MLYMCLYQAQLLAVVRSLLATHCEFGHGHCSWWALDGTGTLLAIFIKILTLCRNGIDLDTNVLCKFCNVNSELPQRVCVHRFIIVHGWRILRPEDASWDVWDVIFWPIFWLMHLLVFICFPQRFLRKRQLSLGSQKIPKAKGPGSQTPVFGLRAGVWMLVVAKLGTGNREKQIVWFTRFSEKLGLG